MTTQSEYATVYNNDLNLADNTCDFSKELVEEYGISIVPLHIVLGEGIFG